MPWGVRRIEEESFEPTSGDGRRSAMTVGEWLDSVSSVPRGRVTEPDASVRSDRASSGSLETLDRKLEELNRRLKRLADNPKTQQQDRRPDRESYSSRRNGRDRTDEERETRREQQRDPLSDHLDQIDRRLAKIAKSPRDGGSYGRKAAARSEKAPYSDVDRLRQGLREIERLQAALLEGLNDRTGNPNRAVDRLLQEDRERGSRYASPVAETISRLEAEVRGLRQTVENRLEPAQSAFDDSDLQDMRRMLARLSEVGTDRQDSAQVERLFDEMNRLRDLVIETGTKAYGASSAKSAQESRLADMVERLASVATSAQEKTSDDMRSLERRLADVAERMADVEGRGASAKDIAELQRAISGIAAKLDRPQPAQKPVIPAGLVDLDIRIEKLSEKLDRLEPNQKPVIPAGLIDLDIRIERLSEKLDRIEPNPVATRQLASLETEISALRLDLAQTTSKRGATQLEEQISALSDKIDRLATAAPSGTQGASLDKFETRISDLVGMLDRMAGSEASLDKHVDALQGEVAALRRDLSNLSAPARNVALEEQMRLLADRLQSAGNQANDPRVLAKIDDKINRLADLVNASERKSTDTGAIEAKLGKLEILLADRREDALEAASAAAREAVREFASFATEARQSETSVRALEDDLRQVQASSRTTEVRTSDALQSVHDALTTIVSRLGAIERSTSERVVERIPDREPERGYGEPLSPNRVAAPQGPVDAPYAEQRFTLPSEIQPTAPTQAPQPRAVEPPASSFEDHRPLEPGSGKPRAPHSPSDASVARAQQPVAQPQMPRTQTAPAHAPVAAPQADSDAPPGPRRNDFIAAARRAALAASQPGLGEPPPIPGERINPAAYSDGFEEAPKSKSLFKSLFQRKQKSLIIAGVGIAAAATAISFITAGIMRVTSVDQMPTASISAPGPSQIASGTPAMRSPDSSPASVALAPPSSVTSTFSQPSSADDVARQAALADAVKQAALAQGIKPQQPDITHSTHQPALTDVAKQQMPPPIVASLTDTPISDTTNTQSIGKPVAQAPVAGPVALATEKIGSLALRTAAASGDPKAQFEIAMRFSEGRGIAPDTHEAAVWFERSASHGFIPAAYRLGSAYEKGLGVDRSATDAKRWYRTAAEGGNIRAMHNLGVLYANERDMPSALPWFQKAAEAGLKDSEFNLGIIYALGSGVKQDLAVSYKWFALGAVQGDQEAVKKRDDIATHLDRTALAAAKMAVTTWRPAPISRDANEETAVWSEPAATASATPSTAAAPPPPNGWTRTMQAQAALQGKGLYTGKIDGEMTPETKAAIKAFQKKAGLRQSGEIDPAFINAVVAKQM